MSGFGAARTRVGRWFVVAVLAAVAAGIGGGWWLFGALAGG